MAVRRENEEIEIDLIQLFKVLWRKALVIILSAAIFGAATFAVTLFLIKPKYEATASMYVNNSSFSFGSTSFSISSSELTASTSLVSTYIFILSPELHWRMSLRRRSSRMIMKSFPT